MDRDPVGPEGASGRVSGSRSTAVPRYLRWLGGALGLGLIVELLVGASPLFPFGSVLAARVLTSVPFVVGILYGSYWLDRGGVSPERYARVGLWCLGAAVAFVVINLGIMISVPPANALIAVGWFRWAITLGAGIGLTIGVVEARAIEREVIAEHARVQFEGTERRAELVAYVRDLLAAGIIPLAEEISEEATHLADGTDPGSSGHETAGAIRRRAESLVVTAEHVRELLDSTGGTADAEPVNLTAALTDALAEIRRDPSVEATASLPEEDVFVLADRLLDRVFAIVFAYLTGRAGTASVSVSVDATDDAVTVRITDDGPPLPDDSPALADGPDRIEGGGAGDPDTERGFALAGVLVEYYDGAIELEAAPDGNTVAIEFRRVAVDGARPPPGPAAKRPSSS